MSGKDEFEEKLQKMKLSELKQYRKELDKKIKQRVLMDHKSFPVYPIVFIRATVDYEIKSRKRKTRRKME